jgi:NMT1/THI5 like
MNVFRTARSIRYVAGLAVAVLVSGTIVACSSGSSGDAGSAGSASTLRWSANTVTMTQAIIYAAMGRGSFKKYGLTVKFVPTTSNPTALATGSTDVIVGRASDPMLLINQGKPVKVIGSVAVDTPTGLLGTDGVKTIQDLQKMGSNCILAGIATGTFATYLKFWGDKYGLKCKIDNASDYNTTIDGTVAGRYTASVQLLTNAGAAIASGKAHWLLNPLDPTFKADGDQLPDHVINSDLTVTADYAAKHAAQIKAFISGLKDAEAWMKTATNQQIAQAIKDSGVAFWQPQSVDQIVEQLTGAGTVKNVFQGVGVNVAPISQQLWNESLKTTPEQGVQINVNDPRYSYSAVYDNSAFE